MAKQTSYSQKINKVTDGMGMYIEEGIKPLVQALWDQVYNTSMSCEGHSDRGRKYTWIDLPEKLNDIERIEEMIKAYNERVSQTVKWELRPHQRYEIQNLEGKIYELKPVDGTPLKKAQSDVKNLAAFISPESDIYRYKESPLQKMLSLLKSNKGGYL